MPQARNVTELSLSCPRSLIGAVDLLKHVFAAVGISQRDLIESVEDNAVCVKVYGLAPRAAKDVRKKIRDVGLKDVKIHLKTLRPRDWQERWKEDLRPFTLTKRFDVVPLWRKKEYRSSRRSPIFIDTVMAFGTGQHETTRFMVRLIERCEGKFRTFLDVGTGTGILSIAAFKCAAAEVSAVDIDPTVIEVAKKNLDVNGSAFKQLQVVDIARIKSRKQYDFVAANLVTARLITCGRKLFSLVRPGQFLAVSGISLQNLKILRDAYRSFPLRCLKVEKGKEWVAILYKRI